MVQQVKDPALSLQRAAVAWVPSLAQELPHAVGVAKKKKKKKRIQRRKQNYYYYFF